MIFRSESPTPWWKAGVEETDVSLDEQGSAMETNNLRLIPVERVHVQALLRDKRELAAILRVTVPDGWPHFLRRGTGRRSPYPGRSEEHTSEPPVTPISRMPSS